MIEFTWVLLLTVCYSGGDCISQKVGYYKDEPQCVWFQKEHEALPVDGDWSIIKYHCRPKNSKST
tara:strand:+ start:561 stop:755 length:195 start_codon:yes stop_codon:yes gene_type:complete